jgi:hypothetical protein
MLLPGQHSGPKLHGVLIRLEAGQAMRQMLAETLRRLAGFTLGEERKLVGGQMRRDVDVTPPE